jgi:5-formyltetrahydrofolate cyclo-ligase
MKPAATPLPSAPAADKPALRRALLAARQALAQDTANLATLDTRLGAELRRLLDERAPRCVGFYWPTAGEFDARAAVAAWLAAAPGRTAALPVVTDAAEPLAFHLWHPASAMREGRYRIPVPAEARPAEPDLLLIPCVGFDPQRLRLGYGGGFYDRTLAARAARPYAVGVAYACARLAELPRETHDIPLDLIVTEDGWI